MLEPQSSLLCRAHRSARRVAFGVVVAGAVLSAGPVAAAPGGVPGKPATSPSDGHGNDMTSSTAATTATGASSSSRSRGGQAPPGNNGHIQIDKYDMDGGGNEPHVACGFSVSFFGYDAGSQQASITLTPHAPTRGGHAVTVKTSWQTATRTGGNQLEKNVQVSPSTIADAFSGVRPAKQGYHARIDVHVTGSQGSDAKHQVLWIKPCAPASTTTSVTSSTTSTTAQPTTTTTASANATGAAAGASATRAKAEPKVGANGGNSGSGQAAQQGAAATTQAPPAGAVGGGASFTG